MIGTHTGPGMLGVAGLRTELLGPDVARNLRPSARLERRARWASRSILRSAAKSRRSSASSRFTVARSIVRTLLIVVVFALSLYLIYLLRKPIGWVLIAMFLAVALSGPVNLLNQRMRRGFAIAIVYLGLLLIPIGIGALIVPPLVTQGNNLVQDLPALRAGRTGLRRRERSGCAASKTDYNITEKLQEEAEKLPGAASATRRTCSATSASASSTRSSRCSRS